MNIDEKLIRSVLLKGERITLEAKCAEKDIPKTLWETYSAFANTNGGMILLGIKENLREKNPAKRFEILGVENAEKMCKDFWNTINSNKVSLNILKDSDVEVVDMSGKFVICIRVPQADWREKPIFLNENVYKGTFRRNHEGDYHCTERQVKAMIRDSFDGGNDGTSLEQYDMRDIDIESLHRYRTLFKFKNEGHIWNEVDDTSFLRNLGGCIVNRETGKVTLTTAGLMMFGTGLAVRERFPNFRMDYINMSNLIGDERYSDRLTYDGRWENNLYQFFSIVLPKITFDLPRPFHMVGVQRDDDTPQHKAVREAFTNSIIHADLLMESGVLRIEKHDDKLVFRNPGLLRLPLQQIYEGGVSFARNPKIQNMLRMVGYGENLGSGFPKIISAWKEAGWGDPILENKIELDEVSLTLPVVSSPSKTNDSDKKSNKKSSKKNESVVFVMISNNPTISLSEIHEESQLSISGVRKVIERLKNKGLIRRVGPDKGGYWEVIKNIEP